MHIILSLETQRLLEARMKKSGYSSADEAVRTALQTLDDVEGESLESLDTETLHAIDRAESESARGEGRPWVEVARNSRQNISTNRWGRCSIAIASLSFRKRRAIFPRFSIISRRIRRKMQPLSRNRSPTPSTHLTIYLTAADRSVRPGFESRRACDVGQAVHYLLPRFDGDCVVEILTIRHGAQRQPQSS